MKDLIPEKLTSSKTLAAAKLSTPSKAGDSKTTGSVQRHPVALTSVGTLTIDAELSLRISPVALTLLGRSVLRQWPNAEDLLDVAERETREAGERYTKDADSKLQSQLTITDLTNRAEKIDLRLSPTQVNVPFLTQKEVAAAEN